MSVELADYSPANLSAGTATQGRKTRSAAFAVAGLFILLGGLAFPMMAQSASAQSNAAEFIEPVEDFGVVDLHGEPGSHRVERDSDPPVDFIDIRSVDVRSGNVQPFEPDHAAHGENARERGSRQRLRKSRCSLRVPQSDLDCLHVSAV